MTSFDYTQPTHESHTLTLEVGPAAPADEQRVAGKGHGAVVQHEGDAAVGVPRGGPHLEVVGPEAVLCVWVFCWV